MTTLSELFKNSILDQAPLLVICVLAVGAGFRSTFARYQRHGQIKQLLRECAILVILSIGIPYLLFLASTGVSGWRALAVGDRTAGQIYYIFIILSSLASSLGYKLGVKEINRELNPNGGKKAQEARGGGDLFVSLIGLVSGIVAYIAFTMIWILVRNIVL